MVKYYIHLTKILNGMKMKFNKTDDELKHMTDEELFEYLEIKI